MPQTHCERPSRASHRRSPRDHKKLNDKESVAAEIPVVTVKGSEQSSCWRSQQAILSASRTTEGEHVHTSSRPAVRSADADIQHWLRYVLRSTEVVSIVVQHLRGGRFLTRAFEEVQDWDDMKGEV